jgi:hypothetical protein
MTDDLVKRLRTPNGPFNWEDAVATYLEAADCIEQLERELRKLEHWLPDDVFQPILAILEGKDG